MRRRKNAHALQVGVAGAVMKLGEVEKKKESMEFSLMQQKDGQQIDVIILRANHVFSHTNNTTATIVSLLLLIFGTLGDYYDMCNFNFTNLAH